MRNDAQFIGGAAASNQLLGPRDYDSPSASRASPIHSSYRVGTYGDALKSEDSAMSTPQNGPPKESLPVHSEGRNASDWESSQQDTSKPTRPRFQRRALGWAITDRVDQILPPHKRYLGRSRRTLCIFIVFLLLFILGFVIGLSIGLTKKSKYTTRRLPLFDD